MSFAPKSVLAAVVFDLDGVITNTAEYHYQAWQRLAGELGVPFDRKKNDRLRGVSRMESLEILLEGSGLKLCAREKIECAERKNRYYTTLISAITPKDILPGVFSLLGDLKKHGVKLALASASKNALTVVKLLEVERFFDFMVNVSNVQNGKPAPDLFLSAAAGVGAQPGRCVGVEDAAAGIQAIKAAGMKAVGVGYATRDLGADLVVDTTADLSAEKLFRLLPLEP